MHSINLLHGADLLPYKLTSPQPIKKFPAFYGTKKFITAITRTHHLPLSLADNIKIDHTEDDREL
jgi:hypothetical protein